MLLYVSDIEYNGEKLLALDIRFMDDRPEGIEIQNLALQLEVTDTDSNTVKWYSGLDLFYFLYNKGYKLQGCISCFSKFKLFRFECGIYNKQHLELLSHCIWEVGIDTNAKYIPKTFFIRVQDFNTPYYDLTLLSHNDAFKCDLEYKCVDDFSDDCFIRRIYAVVSIHQDRRMELNIPAVMRLLGFYEDECIVIHEKSMNIFISSGLSYLHLHIDENFLPMLAKMKFLNRNKDLLVVVR